MSRKGFKPNQMSDRLRSMFTSASKKDKSLQLKGMVDGLSTIMIVPHAFLDHFWRATASGWTWLAIMVRLHAGVHVEKHFDGLDDVDDLAIAFRAMYNIEARYLTRGVWRATALEIADISLGLDWCDALQEICTETELRLAFQAAAEEMKTKDHYL